VKPIVVEGDKGECSLTMKSSVYLTADYLWLQCQYGGTANRTNNGIEKKKTHIHRSHMRYRQWKLDLYVCDTYTVIQQTPF
jgi:hypothetical protein